jgi:Transglycosylase SLT domain
MTPDVYNAIVSAAQQYGIDPYTALAIADRESSGSVTAGSGSPYSSAFGLFQMLKGERAKYGGSSTDPYEQASAWGQYIQGTRNEMAQVLGRDPTGDELYLGHYFGGTRAARMVTGQIPPTTPVTDVFSPTELAANPNITRAGYTGPLASSIQNDIMRRTQAYGGQGSSPVTGSTQSQPGQFDAYGEDQTALFMPQQNSGVSAFTNQGNQGSGSGLGQALGSALSNMGKPTPMPAPPRPLPYRGPIIGNVQAPGQFASFGEDASGALPTSI